MKLLAALMMACSFAIVALAAPPPHGHVRMWKCEILGVSKHSHQENLFDGFGLSETEAQEKGMVQCRPPKFTRCHVASCAVVTHQ